MIKKIRRDLSAFLEWRFPKLPPVQGLKQKEYTTAWRDLNSPAADNPPSPPHNQDMITMERDRMPGKANAHKYGCYWPLRHCSCVSRRV